MGLEVEVEYEDEFVCEKCGHKQKVKGVAYTEIEPPDRAEAWD